MRSRADAIPSYDDVRAAAARLEGVVHRTPTVTSRSVDAWVGCSVVLKCEHLQRVGAFKFRGASNAVALLDPDDAARGVGAHSSGNHAAALALAARDHGISAHIVMPTSAPAPKRAATIGYGAEVTFCEPTLEARESALTDVLERTGAAEIHPYDDPDVIAGAGTACDELLADHPELDAVICPVGGGGLASGTVLAARGRRARTITVLAAEPAGADDASRSLAEHRLLPSVAPDTVCDGLLTSLSPRTFAILADPETGLDAIVVVPDDETVDAVRLLMERAKMVVEPSGAIGVAAARRAVQDGLLSSDAQVGVVLSGGNIDLTTLRFT